MSRLPVVAMLIPALVIMAAWPVQAAAATQPPPPTTAQAPSPLAAHDPPPEGIPAPRARLTWEEHFARANLAHDGHLTLEEAKVGYPTVARHFRTIDMDGKGFVTENDIRAWKALEKSVHQTPREAAEDPLRPRNAFHQMFTTGKPLNTLSDHTVAQPADKARRHPPEAPP